MILIDLYVIFGLGLLAAAFLLGRQLKGAPARTASRRRKIKG